MTTTNWEHTVTENDLPKKIVLSVEYICGSKKVFDLASKQLRDIGQSRVSKAPISKKLSINTSVQALDKNDNIFEEIVFTGYTKK